MTAYRDEQLAQQGRHRLLAERIAEHRERQASAEQSLRAIDAAQVAVDAQLRVARAGKGEQVALDEPLELGPPPSAPSWGLGRTVLQLVMVVVLSFALGLIIFSQRDQLALLLSTKPEPYDPSSTPTEASRWRHQELVDLEQVAERGVLGQRTLHIELERPDGNLQKAHLTQTAAGPQLTFSVREGEAVTGYRLVASREQVKEMAALALARLRAGGDEAPNEESQQDGPVEVPKLRVRSTSPYAVAASVAPLSDEGDPAVSPTSLALARYLNRLGPEMRTQGARAVSGAQLHEAPKVERLMHLLIVTANTGQLLVSLEMTTGAPDGPRERFFVERKRTGAVLVHEELASADMTRRAVRATYQDIRELGSLMLALGVLGDDVAKAKVAPQAQQPKPQTAEVAIGGGGERETAVFALPGPPELVALEEHFRRLLETRDPAPEEKKRAEP